MGDKMLFNKLGDVSQHERKNLKLLLIIGGLYTLGIYLSNVFVNIYLWKQSGKFPCWQSIIYLFRNANINFYFNWPVCKKN